MHSLRGLLIRVVLSMFVPVPSASAQPPWVYSYPYRTRSVIPYYGYRSYYQPYLFQQTYTNYGIGGPVAPIVMNYRFQGYSYPTESQPTTNNKLTREMRLLMSTPMFYPYGAPYDAVPLP